jgi:hypothetical protein
LPRPSKLIAIAVASPTEARRKQSKECRRPTAPGLLCPLDPDLPCGAASRRRRRVVVGE